MTRYATACLLALLLFADSGPLRADPPASDADGMRLAIHDVASLTAGHTDFFSPPYMGVSYDPDAVGPWPEEAEMRVYLHGSAEELIELIKTRVRPRYWEDTEGASIAANGESNLVIGASAAVHKEVAAYLAEIETPSSIQVSLCVARTSPDKLDAWRERANSTVLPDWAQSGAHAAITVHPTDRCVVTRCVDRSLVIGQEIVKSADHVVAVPRVGVGHYGFTADVRVMPVGNQQRDLLNLNAALAQGTSAENAMPVDLRKDIGAAWRQSFVVARGAWSLVGISGHFALFVRTLIPEVSETSAARPIHWLAQVPEDAPDGAMTARSYPVFDIPMRWGGLAARFQRLHAPHEEMPEPPELPQAQWLWGPDSMVELLQATTPERYWEHGSITIQNGVLLLRNALPVHEMVAKNIEVIRDLTHRSVVTEVRVHEVPGKALAADPGALLAHIATTQPTHTASVRSEHDRTGFSSGGATHRYIEGYNIEATAPDKGIGTPVIAEIGLGLTVQLRANIESDGSDVLLDLRFLQQTLRQERSVRSAHGQVALPEVDVFRGKAMLRAPMNTPTIAFSATHGDTLRVVSVIPRLER